MANEQNLITGDMRTLEERRELAKKAGIASGKARRQKRDLRECAKLFMELSATDDIKNKIVKNTKLKNKDVSNSMAMVVSLFQKALSGRGNVSINSANTLIKLLGLDSAIEKEPLNVQAQVQILEDIPETDDE